MLDMDRLSCRAALAGWCCRLFERLFNEAEVPVSNFAVSRPEGGILCFVFVFLIHSDFCSFGPFDLRGQHPDLSDLNSFSLEIATDFVVGRRLIKAID